MTRIRQAQGFYFPRPFLLEDLSEMRRIDAEGRGAETARPRVQGRTPASPRGLAARAGG